MSPNRQPSFDPERDRILDDNYELHQIKRLLLDSADNFGRQVQFGSVNSGDLPSSTTFTPIRYRLSRTNLDGSGYERLNYAYGDGSGVFEDRQAGDEDVFVLSPNEDTALQFKTAQRFEYVVGYDALPTLAFVLSRELQPGDRLLAGLDTSYPPLEAQDGYFLEQTGSMDPTEVNLFEQRNGNVIGAKQTVSLERALTVFQRFAIQYNWYNVGVNRWVETYTDADEGQQNVPIGTTSVQEGDANAGPGGRGPISGNGRIGVEIQRGPGNDPIELHAGSMGFIVLGDDIAAFESKWAKEDGLSVTQSGEYEPIMIIRADPGDPDTLVQFGWINVIDGPGGDILAQSFDKDLLLNANGNQVDNNTDWKSPGEHGVSEASAIEYSTDIDQFPDENGTLVTSTTRPGGFQSAGVTAAKNTSGNIFGEDASRSIPDGDYVAILAKPDGTGADFDIEYVVRESQ